MAHVRTETTGSEDSNLAEAVIDEVSKLEVGQVFHEDTIIEWVATNLEPEDVYGEDALEQWALDNGFKKSDE